MFSTYRTPLPLSQMHDGPCIEWLSIQTVRHWWLHTQSKTTRTHNCFWDTAPSIDVAFGASCWLSSLVRLGWGRAIDQCYPTKQFHINSILLGALPLFIHFQTYLILKFSNKPPCFPSWFFNASYVIVPRLYGSASSNIAMVRSSIY